MGIVNKVKQGNSQTIVFFWHVKGNQWVVGIQFEEWGKKGTKLLSSGRKKKVLKKICTKAKKNFCVCFE